MRTWIVLGLLGMVAATGSGCGGGAGGALGASAPAPGPAVGLTLTSLVPAAADVGGGAVISVLGSGYAAGPGPVYVHFGSRVARATVLDDGLLRVVVPRGDEAANVDVVVTSPHGFAALAHAFLYLPPSPPTPTLACVPRVGSVSASLGGTRIDLHVTGLPALVAPGVTLGGLLALNLVRLDATSVRVDVPPGLPVGQAVEVVLSDGPLLASTWDFWIQGALEPGSLGVNEFLPDPGTLDANRDGTLSGAGDEFVELVNALAVAVDLTGFTLSDASSVRHTFPNPTTVPAGGSIVVFGSGNPTFFPARHASGHAQLASTGTLGLNNAADSIVLKDPLGTIVARADYANADSQPGRSRTAVSDGQLLPVPAASGAYVFHDLAAGALGTLSPGVRVTGAPFL